MRISSILHNKFKLHFSNISFLILSFLKKLINNAFEYHRENRMSSEFYHKVQLFWEGHKNLRNLPHGFDVY